MTTLDQPYINATQTWLNKLIIGYNLCPFAKQERDRDSIRYSVDHHVEVEACLLKVMLECLKLDADKNIETTLIIFTHAFQAFDDYLDFLAMAEALINEQGYEGIYQLASFHPEYCFEGESQDDPANYTNRSPYPMLHLLREDSIEQAINQHPDIENVPQRNIELTRSLGLDKLRSLLESCLPSKKPLE